MPIVSCSPHGRPQGSAQRLRYGLHIRTGEWIVANHRVPAGDIFLFRRPGSVVLPGVALRRGYAWLNGHGGLRRGGLFAILLLALTSRCCSGYYGGNRSVRGDCRHHVGRGGIFDSLAGETHLFTLLFLVLFYARWKRFREGRTRLAAYRYLVIMPW